MAWERHASSSCEPQCSLHAGLRCPELSGSLTLRCRQMRKITAEARGSRQRPSCTRRAGTAAVQGQAACLQKKLFQGLATRAAAL